MADYRTIPTSAEVCAVIRVRHELQVFSSFSDPDGRFNGGAGEFGRMETAYAIAGCHVPLIEYRTTWEIDPEVSYRRINEKHEYWLCVPIKED